MRGELMNKLLAVLALALCSCDPSGSSAPPKNGVQGWTRLPCPSYSADSGLFKTVDPDNGNIIYMHLGSSESAIFVVPGPKK